jgi:hypothetical protein
MLIAVFTTFAADRKEPLGDAVERVHAAFLAARFGEPKVHFAMSDSPGSVEINLVQEIAGIKRVSSIARGSSAGRNWSGSRASSVPRRAAAARRG